jgi:DNA-binding beta-propeller fold protein YncE
LRKLSAALAALSIALCGCASGRANTATQRPPSLLLVPYFTVVGDVWSSKSVLVYKVDAATGNLALATGSPFTAGSDPTSAAFARSGPFAYVINKDSGSISGYDVDSTTAALKPVPSSPFALDYSSFGPSGIVVDPAGTFVYVASDAGVSALSIDPATGALARIPGSPFGTVRSDGFGTASIAIDPSDRHAYVLNYFRNTVSAYTIDAGGALKPAGSPLDAGQNSNDPGALSNVTIDPKGRFAYVTANCCLYVYAIDAASGALTPSAHVSLGEPGEFAIEGFAIDPSGRFAYALNDSRVYAYGIDGATGKLTTLDSRGADAGAEPYYVTVDPAGAFAYVFDRGSPTAAMKIYAYRIDSATGRLTPLARSPFAVAAGLTDPVARWFNAGVCAKFTGTLWNDAHPPPVSKRDSESLVVDRDIPAMVHYFYDPARRVAVHYSVNDSGGTITLRTSGGPPASVARRDLSALRTTSGIKIGSSAAMVVGALGEPKIVAGCYQQKYVYLQSGFGEPLALEFTITRGRVTEISEELGG